MSSFTNNSEINNKQSDVKLILDNIQMFSKYKSLSKESIYNTLENTTINSKYEHNVSGENTNFWYYSRKILSLSFPTIFFYLILHLQQTICLSFLGKTTKNQEILNGYGIVNLYLTCTNSCILTGLVSGLDTLLPSAWSNKNMRLFNVYVQRARSLCFLIGIIISTLNYFTALKVLRFFNASNESLIYANDFLLPALLTTFLDCQFCINFTILAVINKIKESLICMLIDIIIHIFLCFIYIDYSKMGIFGAGFSLFISQLLNYLMTTVIINIYNKDISHSLSNREIDNRDDEIIYINSNSNSVLIEIIPKVNYEIVKGYKSYIYFTLPNTVLLAAEWMAFEIQGLIALSMTTNDYSIHLLLTNIFHLTNTFSSGFGMATAILIAEKVGRLIIKESRVIVIYSFIIAQVVLSIIVILILIFRNSIFQIFTEEFSLIELGKSVIPYLALFSIVDATQAVMAGSFRGYGKQKIASLIALFQYYIIQTLLSYILGIKLNWGIYGIWLSMLIGAISTTIIYFICFLFFDYGKILKETKERLETDVSEIELSLKN